MSVITAIKLQKRDTSHCNIYIDQRYAFVIASLDVSALGLKVGSSINDEQLQHLQNLAQSSRSYRLALQYLAIRARSTQEIMQYLRRKEIESEEISHTVSRLRDSGLIDDLKFAKMWVADRMALRPRSRRQLEQELAAKGIGRSDIQQALSSVSGSDITAVLERLIDKKRRIGVSDDAKITQYLLRQGFEYAQIKAALAAAEHND